MAQAAVNRGRSGLTGDSSMFEMNDSELSLNTPPICTQTLPIPHKQPTLNYSLKFSLHTLKTVKIHLKSVGLSQPGTKLATVSGPIVPVSSKSGLSGTSKPLACPAATRVQACRGMRCIAKNQRAAGPSLAARTLKLGVAVKRVVQPVAASKSATEGSVAAAPRRVPRSIHDVDNGSILGFGADLGEDHPGFHDQEYKNRRIMIANLARQHQVGEPIPDIAYTPEELAVWGQCLRELRGLFPLYACRQYLQTFNKFNFREDKVPQLQEMSDVLHAATGWTIRPVAGLMHPRDFLAGLAFKTFHSTQYMRHASKPSYTPEPDLVHELIGHVPMLADPAYADLVQAIGIASLEADDKMIWHLTKVYWFTVEFGVLMEGGQPKAFGAGVLSSFGEMAHMASGVATLLPFDPFAPQPKMSYKDGYQKSYFALESFEDAACKIRALAATIKLPEEFRGDASVA